MDPDTARLFAAALAILSVTGPAIGIGILGKGATEGTGRNPEAGGQIQTLMIIGAAFVDALGILGFVTSIMILLGVGG